MEVHICQRMKTWNGNALMRVSNHWSSNFPSSHAIASLCIAHLVGKKAADLSAGQGRRARRARRQLPCARKSARPRPPGTAGSPGSWGSRRPPPSAAAHCLLYAPAQQNPACGTALSRAHKATGLEQCTNAACVSIATQGHDIEMTIPSKPISHHIIQQGVSGACPIGQPIC